ncbi:SAM-dependent methyltransferase [Geobacillus genomosp. 3]|uniref:tRNA 5-hydroxyuridine methyltransferase n=1 Tax=Geobacillus genomosp. 3 TaxID=1921421 RepID=S5Z7T8_GEOG3|nr:O-methyltransferase [Geobacillus genomosp. 3]AGT32887.1 SAM-dependent methyltransferase [Geobacillus genomosp. 3]
MLPNDVVRYLQQLRPAPDPDIAEMERYAREHRVPIMDPVSMEVLLFVLKTARPRRILEIGTAIGYSAIRMAKALPEARIVTIERDRERYERARFYIGKTNTGRQIEAVFGDALAVGADVAAVAPFDALFIDAAKGQYERFFTLYEPLLAEGGLIISDNVLFKGLVAAEAPGGNKRLWNIAKKIRRYNEWLMARNDYDTVIIPVGDGLAISKKRGERE